jgi:hypothetical protein
MDYQALSRRIDALIAELLEHKRREQNAGRKKVRVLITGDSFSSLQATLLSLEALESAGYQLLMTFSHSACLSGLKAACIGEVDSRCAGVVYCEQEPVSAQDEGDYSSLFLPALSTNSLSKIALCIRDNMASAWVFHALNSHKKVIATLNSECLNSSASGFASALLNRLAEYVATLEQYGVVIAGQKMSGVIPRSIGHVGKSVSLPKHLITLSDILTFSGEESLHVDSHTLITPAAQDEIRRQNITVIQGS